MSTGATDDGDDGAGFTGIEWQAVDIDGDEVAGGGRPPVLQFGDDGRVSGSTGVNRLAGTYTVEGDQLVFGAMVSTRMAGPPRAMATESRFLSAVSGPCSYWVEEAMLVIEGDGGRVTFEERGASGEEE